MGLNLSAEDIAAPGEAHRRLDCRPAAGGHFNAGTADTASFIRSFTGSHHFVLDYLVEEVLQQQSERVQTFLLRTPSSSACAAPCVTPLLPDSCLLPGKRPWNISNTPTCSSSRWTTSGTGTAITISLRICCGSGCSKYHLVIQG